MRHRDHAIRHVVHAVGLDDLRVFGVRAEGLTAVRDEGQDPAPLRRGEIAIGVRRPHLVEQLFGAKPSADRDGDAILDAALDRIAKKKAA